MCECVYFVYALEFNYNVTYEIFTIYELFLVLCWFCYLLKATTRAIQHLASYQSGGVVTKY